MQRNRARLIAMMWIVVFVLAAGGSALAQEKKVLTLDDYARWRRIGSTTISPDGNWMTYAYNPNEGNDTLYVELLEGDTKYTVPLGSGPVFSDDSKWVAYMISPPEEEGGRQPRGRGQAGGPAGGAAGRKFQLLELASGTKYTESDAASFRFSEDAKFLAIKKRQIGGEAEHSGTDLILRDLTSGVVQNIGNVSAFAFSEAGTMLAYTVDAAGGTGNGVYLMDLGESNLRLLDTSDMEYAQLSWNEEGSALAVLRGKKEDGKEQKGNTLLAWVDVGGRRERAVVYDPAEDSTFPENMVVSEFAALNWSKDDSKIFLGLKQQEEEAPESDEPQADVDIWHWKDVPVQSVQMRRASRDRNFTYTSVLHLDGMKLLQLADDDMRSVTFTEDGRWAVGRLDTPYRGEITWGGSRADYYRIDTGTGERALMVVTLGRSMGASPDGKWYLYLKDKTLWVQNIASGETTDLSALAGVNFVNEDDDHPYEKPAYGVAGWAENGRAVLVNHKFDIWSLPLGGGRAVNITGGMGEREQIRFRYFRLDREEETIDTSKLLLLSANGEWTKKSGYYQVRIGREPVALIYEDRSIGRPTKAEHADRIMFTMQTFVDFPDYYVSDTSFHSPRRITEANPQQAEYAWGTRVLMDYENSRGVHLQATLTLPAGYERGRRYPMLVYFYEKMSGRHHSYSMPTYDDRPHMCTYASDGYLVLMPDVVYVDGRPGDSAMDCVGSAVRRVIELGYADPDHIGLQGHSWGGYQSSFMVTQTEMFAAVVTGAPPTNLISFYNTLYKSSGNVQQGITEVGQVRMGTTPFDDFDLFISQSPVHQAGDITTPFMILHGTEDGSVDWIQGLEYYNMAHRQGKEVIFLSYPGEGHHLRRKENQIDFQIRMKQYFDHYLKGEPAPKWLTDGVPFLRKGREPPN